MRTGANFFLKNSRGSGHGCMFVGMCIADTARNGWRSMGFKRRMRMLQRQEGGGISWHYLGSALVFGGGAEEVEARQYWSMLLLLGGLGTGW